jgi:hypothetical protein
MTKLFDPDNQIFEEDWYICRHCQTYREPILDKKQGFSIRLGCLNCNKWHPKNIQVVGKTC